MVFRILPILLLPLLVQGQTAPGLIGRFTDGTRTAHFVAATPNFYLESSESVHPALLTSFRGEWLGELQILRNGDYEFSHDVTLDGQSGKKHTLAAGAHRLSVRYQREPGVAQLRLLWRSPSFDWEPVPPGSLSHQRRDEPVDGIEQGRALIAEARCGNCHAAAGLERPAPPLAGIGGRTNRNWLYAWLGRHQFIAHTPQQSADMAAYLATLRPATSPRQRRTNEVAIGKGGELFGTTGCIHCHGSTISGLGSKYTLSALTDHLLNTHQPSMLLSDEDALALASYLTRSTDASLEKAAAEGDAARGAETVKSLGCAGCHQPASTGKPLAELRSEACTKLQIAFTPGAARAVRAFLSGPADRSPAPVHELPRNLRRYGCANCHKPGTEAPPLDGAGEKLKTSWIGDVLWGKKRIRGGRELRMPHYAEASMRPWVASFAKAEGIQPGDGPAPPVFTGVRRAEGIAMLGTNPKKKGMACIGCHDWGENKALGEEGPQLINAAVRMRFDWFERWMRNPARILSGTSMPNYFGSLPRERAMEPIHTLWAGLEMGAKAPIPDGYRTGDLEVTSEAKPVPRKEAIVVRWDMPEATPAAIAVGLPGQLSYCFDAGQSRLLYAWRGGFVDMTGTLLRKTDANRLTPTAALVGEVFWRGADFPFRVGDDKHLPQRRFRGYRIVGGVPQFHYQIDGIDVYEKLTPVVGEKAILREVTVSRVDLPVFFEGRAVPRGTNVKVEEKLGR